MTKLNNSVLKSADSVFTPAGISVRAFVQAASVPLNSYGNFFVQPQLSTFKAFDMFLGHCQEEAWEFLKEESLSDKEANEFGDILFYTGCIVSGLQSAVIANMNDVLLDDLIAKMSDFTPYKCHAGKDHVILKVVELNRARELFDERKWHKEASPLTTDTIVNALFICIGILKQLLNMFYERYDDPERSLNLTIDKLNARLAS